MIVPEIHCAYDEIVNIDELLPSPRNPNTHPQRQVELLGKIIREQGWRAPITVSNRSGYIVRGHGRLQAARWLGLKTVPVDRQDYESDEAELADLVADNRIAELAIIDDEMLVELMGELGQTEIDLELTGFDVEGLDGIIKDAMEKGGRFGVSPIDGPTLRSGERSPFQQMTFTLHDEQVEIIKAAMIKARADGFASGPLNENGNGNALAHIAEVFNRG